MGNDRHVVGVGRRDGLAAGALYRMDESLAHDVVVADVQVSKNSHLGPALSCHGNGVEKRGGGAHGGEVEACA